MDYRTRLLAVVDAYCVATNLSRASVSTRISGGGTFIERLASGKGCTVDSYERAMQWLANHWPEHTEWPESVLRPQRTGQDAA